MEDDCEVGRRGLGAELDGVGFERAGGGAEGEGSRGVGVVEMEVAGVVGGG